jgi:hypothetical protein
MPIIKPKKVTEGEYISQADYQVDFDKKDEYNYKLLHWVIFRKKLTAAERLVTLTQITSSENPLLSTL